MKHYSLSSISILLFVFILYSCSEPVEEKYKIFTDKKAQLTTERTVQDLIPVDSLNITKVFNGSSLSQMKINEASIFAKMDDKIVKLNKQELRTDSTFRLPEGRGPGEIVNFNAANFEVGKEKMAIYDDDAKKTVLYDLNGDFREEFLNGSYRVSDLTMADEDTYYFEVMPGREYLFYKVERAENESVIRQRFQEQTDDVEILAYFGEIVYRNNSLYFGGYSEPMIRRYDLSGEEAKLVFSRAIIDDFNSENNYRKPQSGGDYRVFGYTDEAQFASEDIAVDDNYLYSVRHHNDEEEYKYLDIYDAEDGDYLGSFLLLNYPSEIAVDKEYIYTLENSGSDKYLMKYQKPEMDF